MDIIKNRFVICVRHLTVLRNFRSLPKELCPQLLIGVALSVMAVQAQMWVNGLDWNECTWRSSAPMSPCNVEPALGVNRISSVCDDHWRPLDDHRSHVHSEDVIVARRWGCLRTEGPWESSHPAYGVHVQAIRSSAIGEGGIDWIIGQGIVLQHCWPGQTNWCPECVSGSEDERLWDGYTFWSRSSNSHCRNDACPIDCDVGVRSKLSALPDARAQRGKCGSSLSDVFIYLNLYGEGV